MGILFALAALALPAAASAAQPSGPARALERRLGPQAVLDVDAETGTPRMLARLDGKLSGPADGSPEAVALRYVRAHLDALGLSERDLSSLGRPSVADSGDVSSVRWPQSVDGIEAADRELRVNVTADGRVLSVLGSPASDLDVDTSPGLDAGDAVRAVQDLVGVHRPLTRSGTPSGAERTTRYSDGTTAELAVFRDRLSWRVTYRSASDEVWDAFVDAETGRVLRRVNMVKSAAPALVWERYPGAPTGGTQAPVDLEARGYLVAGANTLDGPNVRAFSDLNDNDAPDSGEEVSRSGGSFAFAFTSFAGPTCGPAAQCSWDPAIAFSWSTNRAQNAVQAFYFANQFHDHLRQPPISFTDRPFEGGDELVLHTDDGANAAGGLPDDDHVNNANMLTPPDGQSPVMQMYLWEPPSFRGANSGDDAGVLYHEYAHGLSTRLVTDAAGVGALNSAQAGAMGEGISDFYAQDYLVERFGGDTATPAQIDMGAYLDAPGRPHSLRSEALDCPVGAPATACPGSPTAGSGGYTYGDFAQILGANRPEVHFDGEIWAQTLWDLRGALGVAEARRTITQGMRLSPPEPSFLDMRNAILLAAASEAQRQAMWSIFAARGMGYYASTTGGDDVGPLQDFSMPPSPGEPRGRVAGRITDAATGAPLPGASAVVGGSFDLRAAAGADGSYSVGGMPARAYQNFIFTAAGYDRQIGSALVGAAATTPLNPTLRRNWAARSGGGIAEGVTLFPGCGLNEAIDQSQATTWSTTAAQNRMVIRLPAAATVAWLSADPGEGCGDDFTSATRQLRIETSVSDTANDWVPVGGTNTAGGVHTFTFADRHRLNDIPITARAGVRRVRVTLLDNFGGPYGDLSEFGVHSIARPSFPVGAPVPDPTPQPSPPTPAPPSPGPPAPGPPSPGPPPPAPPRPPSPPAAPSISLPATGKRSVRFGVTCAVSCRVSARLTVDRRTARRLRLGRSRTAGSLSSRTVGAGRQTVTLRLASRAARALKQRRVRSFRARVSATAAYPGARPVSRSRQLTIRR